jgi:hypothetical protein
MEFIASVMLDPEQPTALRLKAALTIINKAIPDQKGETLALNPTGIQSLRVEFVSGDELTRSRETHAPSRASST